MRTAIDTNVLVALWHTDQQLYIAARKALDAVLERGGLVICGAVYAELLARPGRTESMLNEFFRVTGIRVDWELSEQVWREAGRVFQRYVDRRNRGKQELPRRILADFVIGAHASLNHCRLMTLDQRLYPAAFPELEIISF